MNLNWQKKFKNMVIHHIRSQFLSVFVHADAYVTAHKHVESKKFKETV